MSIIVQKFGGTSVADSQKILAAARKAIRAQQRGHQVVMVVSAMGKNTDLLIDLAKQVCERPSAREMDMLLSTGEQVSVALVAMAVHSLGHKAVSLTGGQIGIRTDSSHTKARIRSISTDRMQRLLDDGNVVIAAGFQGIDEDFNITTLGRGGSDTTAVALAAVLNAAECEIYTDVDGVYTTDPRIVPEARRVERISYDEMLELASLGAGVMHSRSIEFAKKFGVAIHVRSSMTDTTGTMIVAEPESASQAVCGAALTRDEARISVLGVPDVPGTSHEVFSRIASRKITVDMIVQNISEEGRTDISFTVPKDELAATLEAVGEAAEVVGARGVTHDDNVSKVSVVGLGMARQSGVAHKMFRALADAGINIQMITTSEIKISVLVRRDEAHQALRLVHKAFQLDTSPANGAAGSSGASAPRPSGSAGAATPASSAVATTSAASTASAARAARPATNAADVVTRLQGVDMEELVITSIEIDAGQAIVTIRGVPDTPGVAAHVFEEVAAAGVFVDMIVQSYDGHEGAATLSFTVAQDKLPLGLAAAKKLAGEYGCQAVAGNPAVAKLSVSGVGLRSHTGVAIRMFRALAEAGINLEMINTSEVRVNVVVADEHGSRAVECLKRSFGDVMR